MLLPRSDPTVDSCSGRTSPCAYDSSIPTNDDTDTSDFPTSGSYGYMGITMVVILALLAGAFWLHLVRKRAMRAKVQEANQPEAPTSKTPRRPLFTIGSRKPSSSPPATTSQKYPEASLLPQSAEKHAKRVSVPETGKQPRWVSQSGVRKGLVKEVSGGMVVYTAPNRGSKATRPKPTAQPPWRDRKSRRESRSSSWHMDNMCDIAHEMRVPPESPEMWNSPR